MKIKYLYILLSLMFVSCSSWLDVEPKTNIREGKLFATEQGFKEALTGVYILMSNQGLYGKELTYGMLDQLAQRYVNPVESSRIVDFTKPTMYNFGYTSKYYNYTQNFWNSLYNVIANDNNIIGNIQTNGDNIKTPGLRQIIEGEAIGLRAFLHFDLLRMFGPSYKSNKDSLSIVYRREFSRESKKFLKVGDVVDNIIEDLKKAEILLDKDPMNINYSEDVYNSVNENSFLLMRSKRMNKYAVKATLARVYLYKGDMQNAKEKAMEVINATKEDGSKIFELVTDNAKNHIYSTELIFALSQDPNVFSGAIRNDFTMSQFALTNTGDKKRVNQIFDVDIDGNNDIRMREIGGMSINQERSTTQKLFQDNNPSKINNTMPLIRLSEMYYIASESSDNLEESATLLSKVRKARGIDRLNFKDNQDKMYNIEKEYRKEFMAEGQLWYFYKRLEYKTFMFCPEQNMTSAKYTFTLPENEITFGNL